MTKWWEKCQVNDRLMSYHTQYAQFNEIDLDSLKSKRLDENLTAMVQALKMKGIPCTTQGVGSAHDGTHVRHLDGSYELDIQFRLDGEGIKVTPDRWNPGLAKLRPRKNHWCKHLPTFFFDRHAHLDPHHVMEAFKGTFNSLQLPNTTFETHGPAVTMKVCKGFKALWFSVDLVPVINGEDGKDYVPKRQTEWRESFSLDEKSDLMDKDGAKMCLRIVKAFWMRSAELRALRSYDLKNVLLYELDAKPDARWSADYIGRRVFRFLQTLGKYLGDKRLPQFYNRDVNLWHQLDTSKASLDFMASYIKAVCLDKSAFLRAFEIGETQESWDSDWSDEDETAALCRFEDREKQEALDSGSSDKAPADSGWLGLISCGLLG